MSAQECRGHTASIAHESVFGWWVKKFTPPLTAGVEDDYISKSWINYVRRVKLHSWKRFANRLHLVLYACKILLSELFSLPFQTLLM
jgi:hypothetical protein